MNKVSGVGYFETNVSRKLKRYVLKNKHVPLSWRLSCFLSCAVSS